VNKRTWQVMDYEDGAFTILDPTGAVRGKFGSPAKLAEHAAMLMEEIDRLRTGIGFISQLLSDRVPAMIAQATLDGADVLDDETAIEVCEGKWRKPQ
jgi:hypothetical protein